MLDRENEAILFPADGLKHIHQGAVIPSFSSLSLHNIQTAHKKKMKDIFKRFLF